jgi:acyl-CoA thioesterase II
MGKLGIPIVFEVEKIRDGGSFSTRRVVAKQNGLPIFFMSVSFQSKWEEAYEHQIPMPKVEGPENLPSDEDVIKKYSWFVPDHIFQVIDTRPFEFRMVEKISFLDLKTKLPYRHFWFKAKEAVTEEISMNQQLLTYVSDYNLLTTAALPHSRGPIPTHIFMASLDHGLWFHRPFRVDEWLLYAIDSPSGSDGRGFTRGNIFNAQGKLVASVVQEGVMRPNKK